MSATWRDTLGWQIFIGIVPNLVIGALFWFLGVYLADRSAAEAARAKLVSELPQDASDVVLELYPPGALARENTGSGVFKSLQKFESLYWGSLGLLRTDTVEPDLTDLHVTLMQASQGATSSTDPSQSLRQLQGKLNIIAHKLAK